LLLKHLGLLQVKFVSAGVKVKGVHREDGSNGLG